MSLESIILIVKSSVSTFLDWFPRIKAALKDKNIPSKTIVAVNDDDGYRKLLAYWFSEG